MSYASTLAISRDRSQAQRLVGGLLGFQAALSRYLNENGIAAAEVKTEFGEDEEGAPALGEEKDLVSGKVNSTDK